jgi:hypothetical protein
MAGIIQKQRYGVLTVTGVVAIGGIATLTGEIPFSVRIVAVVVFLAFVVANTAYSLHLIDVSAKERGQSAAAQGARDKLMLARQREILDRIQAQDLTGATELLSVSKADLVRQVGAAPEDWSVSSHADVADIRVLGRELSRYAIVPNVTITNRSRSPLSLSAELLVQWGLPSIAYKVAGAHGMPLARWDDILLAFGIDRWQQLLFPLELGGEKSVCGNIVFDIPDAGIGVEYQSLMDVIGGFSDADECERERDCKLTIRDEITLEHHDIEISTIYAPRLGGSGIPARSDLAVAGHAETYVMQKP